MAASQMAASGWMPLSWLLLTLSLCKTPLGETGCLDNPQFLFTGCLSIRFFDSTQHSQLDHLWLTVLHCAALVGLSGRHASHWSPVLPTQPLPREAEDFPRGKRHFKYVPPLTQLIYLSSKEVYWQVLFMHQKPPRSKGFTTMEPGSHWF